MESLELTTAVLEVAISVTAAVVCLLLWWAIVEAGRKPSVPSRGKWNSGIGWINGNGNGRGTKLMSGDGSSGDWWLGTLVTACLGAIGTSFAFLLRRTDRVSSSVLNRYERRIDKLEKHVGEVQQEAKDCQEKHGECERQQAVTIARVEWLEQQIGKPAV